jgi:hypothetical protein
MSCVAAPIVAAAIAFVAPQLSDKQVCVYATTLQHESREHHFDPLIAVAFIQHESRWKATAISRDGEDLGLAQIRSRFYGGCKTDPNPVSAPSIECQKTRASLLDGQYNITLIASQFEQWSKLCQSKTGRSEPQHWLAGIGGYSHPSSGQWCKRLRVKGRWKDLPTPETIKSILRSYRQLVLQFSRKQRK